MFEADRITVSACGCHHDVVTGIQTNECDGHSVLRLQAEIKQLDRKARTLLLAQLGLNNTPRVVGTQGGTT